MLIWTNVVFGYTETTTLNQRLLAARAVGQALAKNPLPVVIPCHRVICSDGNLGGFSDGLEMKKLLLKLEHTPSVKLPARTQNNW